jgi:tRNA(Ile)-lysidine synthase
MVKKKKVSKFLIDARLSKTDKEKIWVLESDKKIIAIIGLRIDNRFKYSPSTKQLLKLHYTRN